MTTDQLLSASDSASDRLTEPESRARGPIPTAGVVAVVTLLVGLPLIVAVVALAGRRWFPVLDLAMTELRIRDVGGRHTPLVGLPGRIGTFPDQGSHPGPLSFWVLAPGYRLFGSSAWAIEVATVMVQLGWIATALWIGHRRAQLAGIALVAAVLAVVIRGYGLSVLTQPWNPYIPLLAWVVVLLATWSVVDRDHMMLIPLVIAASFTAQTHIPYLIMAGGLGIVATAIVVARCWRSDDRRSYRTPLAWTAGLFVALWLAPVIDQIRRDPGNIRRLLDHFGSPTEPAIGLQRGVSLMFRHLDVLDAYSRWSTGSAGRFLLVGFDPEGTIVAGVVFFAVWVVAFAVALRLRRGSLVALHTTIAMTLVLTVISTVRIFGKVWYYLTLWAWATTTLMIVAILWTIGAAVQDRRPTLSLRRVGLVAGTAVAAIATLPMVFVAIDTEHPEERVGEPLGDLLEPTIAALEGGVGAATGPDGRYVVRWTDAYRFGTQGYGLVNELERAGFDVGVDQPWSVPVTPQRVIPTEEATADLILATGGFVDEWRLDDRVVEVATVDQRTSEERAEYETLRRDLIADLETNQLEDLIPLVDTNLFAMSLDPRLSSEAQYASVRMLYLGQETAIFISAPGVAT